jgi:hypothetical protein
MPPLVTFQTMHSGSAHGLVVAGFHRCLEPGTKQYSLRPTRPEIGGMTRLSGEPCHSSVTVSGLASGRGGPSKCSNSKQITAASAVS